MNLFRRIFGKKSDDDTPAPSPAKPSAAEPPLMSDAPPEGAPVHTRRLSPPKDFTTSNTRVRFGINSNIGGRANNEDSALAMMLNVEIPGTPPPLGIFMVADGMG